MAHIGWFFLLDDDLDALDREVRALAPATTTWTSAGRLERHASLRAATEVSRQVWLAEVPPAPDQPAVQLTACLAQGSVLIGGNLGSAGPGEASTEAFERVRAACTAAYRAVASPEVVTPTGDRVRRYRVGPAAAAWWRADPGGRTLRDESVPHLTYGLR